MFVGLFSLGVASVGAAISIYALARHDGRDRTAALTAAGKTFGSLFIAGRFLQWW